MQLYALNRSNELIFAHQAIRKHNYICLECKQAVRLRGGFHRRSHFYHIEPNRICQLSGKTLVHLQVQLFIQQQMPINDCKIEYQFPSINRIADVAWLSKKIVFEVQCSPLSVEEMLARNRDYHSMGWDVVWILHDSRYNQWRLTSVEKALIPHPHYFTNMNAEGIGMIYDQFQSFSKNVRSFRSSPLPIQINAPTPVVKLAMPDSKFLKLVEKRVKTWSLSFEGDLVDLNSSLVHKDLALFYQKEKENLIFIKKDFFSRLIDYYHLLFQLLLEKVCY